MRKIERSGKGRSKKMWKAYGFVFFKGLVSANFVAKKERNKKKRSFNELAVRWDHLRPHFTHLLPLLFRLHTHTHHHLLHLQRPTCFPAGERGKRSECGYALLTEKKNQQARAAVVYRKFLYILKLRVTGHVWGRKVCV